MNLSDFSVVHARPEAANFLDDPLIHCYAGDQVVLTYVSREALMDYFQVSGDKRLTLQQWNLVIDRNLDALKPIIQSRFDRDEWDVHNAVGQSYPKIILRLEDLRRVPNGLTIEVLNLKGGFTR